MVTSRLAVPEAGPHGKTAALRTSCPARLLESLRVELPEDLLPPSSETKRLNAKSGQPHLFLSPSSAPRPRVEQVALRRSQPARGKAPSHNSLSTPPLICTRAVLASWLGGLETAFPKSLSLGHLPRAAEVTPLELLVMSGVLVYPQDMGLSLLVQKVGNFKEGRCM